MVSSEVTDIMSGPLVQWLASCLDDPKALANYDDLVDGVLMYQVFRQIDPEPLYDGVVPTFGNLAQRVKNLQIIFNNLKQFYEDELGHLIIKPPNTTNLGEEPLSHVQDARLILLLLLGCAVQCPTKEKFVTKIKNLDLKIQLEIVDCIKQVTDQSDIVINQDIFENANITGVFEQIKKLIEERDLYKEKFTATFVNDMNKTEDMISVGHNKSLSPPKGAKNHNFADELADSKSKLREQRQILDEKIEALLECQEELGRTKTSLAKIKQENVELARAARTAQTYKDELDAITERAERADRLEVENQRYREKLSDLDLYKTRIEHLRNENQLLNENRGLLEDEVRSLSRNTEKIKDLQARLNEYEKLVEEMSLEQSAGQEKLNELLEENCQLNRLTKAAAHRAALAGLIDEENEPAVGDGSLSEQLVNNAEARVLKLELDNRRLKAIIDSFTRNSFDTTSSRIIELQKRKNELCAEIDSMGYDRIKLSHSKRNFETLCKEALEENKKLQNILKQQKKRYEQQLEICRSLLKKIIDLERDYETVVKEKQRIQLLLEDAQKDLERCLEMSDEKIEELRNAQLMVKKYEALCRELKAKLKTLEKEKNDAIRAFQTLYGTIETKDMALDKYANIIIVLEQKITELDEKIKNLSEEISRLQEVEELYKKLVSKSKMLNETVKTLETKLVTEKLDSQQVAMIFNKLGLTVESLLNLPLDTILERIRGIPIVIDTVKQRFIEEAANVEKKIESESVASITKDLQEQIDAQKSEIKALMTRLQTAEALAEQLKSENASLQVSLSTVQMQSVSQTSEHTTIQLTNAQLTVEKEELMKNLLSIQRVHTQLLSDHVKLESLNQQLKNESETLREDRESLTESLREATTTLRTLQGTCQKLEMDNISSTFSDETEIKNADNHKILQTEYDNLKDDFLLAWNSLQKLDAEHSNLQKSYERMKVELKRMYMKNTEMQKEHKSQNEKYTAMELELSELRRSSDNMTQSYKRQENDRRALMNHVTVLTDQYHELMLQLFEEKKSHHMEERIFIEKLNDLIRLKQILEEKIMEQFRNMGNSPAKKKTFGANLVKKVRKAGCELLSRNRRSWAEDLTKQLDNNKSTTTDSESDGVDAEPAKQLNNNKILPYASELGSVDSEPTKNLNNNKTSTSESESGGVDSEPTKNLNNNKTSTSEYESSGGVDSEPTKNLNNNKTSTSEYESSGGVDSEPAKVLDNNKTTTSESDSVGADSESSTDYKRAPAADSGNSAVAEDKICRWVI